MKQINKVKPEWIADGYVDFLKQLNQWYTDGIIHKECFTMMLTPSVPIFPKEP